MPLKTLVKISGVTNLSDARYCAGMGVDFLGFSVVEGHPDYIAPEQFQQIRGWITGPLVVAELNGLKDPGDLSRILEAYRPDMLEAGFVEFDMLPTPSLPYILHLSGNEIAGKIKAQPAYILGGQKSNPYPSIPYLLKVESLGEAITALSDPTFNGIELKGSPELKPGLKDYSILAEILEHLEA